MEQFLSELCNEVERRLNQIESKHDSVLDQSREATGYLEGIFIMLKDKVSSYTFPTDEDEIYFFKQTKPRLFSNLIYYQKVYNIEINRPPGNNDIQMSYLKREMERINDFFDRNHDFFTYYRSDNRHLDHYYFKRGKPDIHINLDSFSFERDPLFSTCGDFKLAEIIANERFLSYLKQQYDILDDSQSSIFGMLPKRRPTWTAGKNNLTEFIYGVWADGSFDYGNISLAQLTSYFEVVCNIDLGNISSNFSDMKIRNDPTPFLDRLKKKLLKKMGRE